MKVVFVIPIYKRIELSKMCVERLKKQSKKLSFDILLVGDKEELNHFRGVKKVYHQNIVSDKLNAAIQECKGYDRVIIWGSDNFATDNILKPLINSDADIVGYDSIYFYSNRTKKASLFTTDKMSIGVGRSYSSKVLKKYGYEIYNKSANNGLDTIAFRQYQRHFKETILKLEEGYLLDVKHESNITSHAIVNVGKEVEPIWNDLIIELNKLIPKENEKIKLINKKVMEKIKIEITKEVAGMEIGAQRLVKPHIAKSLISRGLAKQVDTTSKKKETVKKQTNDSNTKTKRPAKRSK